MTALLAARASSGACGASARARGRLALPEFRGIGPRPSGRGSTAVKGQHARDGGDVAKSGTAPGQHRRHRRCDGRCGPFPVLRRTDPGPDTTHAPAALTSELQGRRRRRRGGGAESGAESVAAVMAWVMSRAGGPLPMRWRAPTPPTRTRRPHANLTTKPQSRELFSRPRFFLARAE